MRKVLLGSETDDELFQRLSDAVRNLGGSIFQSAWVVGGSQEIVKYTIQLPAGSLEAERETYVGLSLFGPDALVLEVSSHVIVAPNPALERTRGERPWLRNELRCARAAQRERWASRR